MNLRRLFHSAPVIARDETGVAMVEFALLAPMLFMLLLGAYEASNLVLCDMKLEAAAQTAADLIGQTRVVDTSGNANYLKAADFTSITNAATAVMTPFPTGSNQLKIAYASVTYSTGAAVINWHYEVNSAPAISVSSLPNSTPAGNLGSQTAGSTDSVVVVQVTYSYSSPWSYVLGTAYTLREASMNRPRYMNCVPTYLNTNNSCP